MTVISEEAGRIERPRKGSLFGSLYFQVLIGVAAGIAVGWLFPSVAVPLKSLGDFFIRCVKMLLVPIVFATIAVGIARMTDIKELGRVGIKTILYFELASTAALIIGMIVGNVFAPGAGLNVDPATIDTKSIAGFSKRFSIPSSISCQTTSCGRSRTAIFSPSLFSRFFSELAFRFIERQPSMPSMHLMEF